MSAALSAIVVLVNGDVETVFIVPAAEASIQNMEHLRAQIRASGIEDVRVQRIWYSDADRTVDNIEAVSTRLGFILDNYNL